MDTQAGQYKVDCDGFIDATKDMLNAASAIDEYPVAVGILMGLSSSMFADLSDETQKAWFIDYMREQTQEMLERQVMNKLEADLD